MKKSFFVLMICQFLMIVHAEALKISEFYPEAQVGQWILMKSSDGLLTRTQVMAKGENKLTLKIQCFKGDRLISDSEQVVDASEGRVLTIRLLDHGNVRELHPSKTETDDFFQIDFRPAGSGEVSVEKGLFRCKRYRGIYKDRVVRAWILDEVPILHLVKISMQGITVQLVDYGH